VIITGATMYSEPMHLLIDGRNILYRALFATHGDMEFASRKTDKFAAISRFIHFYYDQIRPQHIHVFWDVPKRQVWRRAIYPLYKENRNTADRADFDIGAELAHYEKICQELWTAMGMRQYRVPAMEADDLIYAFCHYKHKEEIVIVSTDSDLTQIPYRFDNVRVFSPQTKKYITCPEFDPVAIKCLSGDKADNITGYRGIADIKSRKLLASEKILLEFLATQGDYTYRRNRILIDLSLCPALVDNILYVMQQMASEPTFDTLIVKDLLHKYKLRGMVTEYPKTILPFSFRQENNNGRAHCLCNSDPNT